MNGREFAPMAYERTLLDTTNRRILKELQAEARLTMAELGRRVSLSPPAVAERVQRLEKAGVITGLPRQRRAGGPRGCVRGRGSRGTRLAAAPEDPGDRSRDA